jgi:hypothetical protein
MGGTGGEITGGTSDSTILDGIITAIGTSHSMAPMPRVKHKQRTATACRTSTVHAMSKGCCPPRDTLTGDFDGWCKIDQWVTVPTTEI